MKNWSTTQIVLTLLGVFAIGAVIGYFVPSVNTWFGKPAEVGKLSDCKTPDGQDGMKDANGNCVALPAVRIKYDANGNPTGKSIRWCTSGGLQNWVDCATLAAK